MCCWVFHPRIWSTNRKPRNEPSVVLGPIDAPYQVIPSSHTRVFGEIDSIPDPKSKLTSARSKSSQLIAEKNVDLLAELLTSFSPRNMIVLYPYGEFIYIPITCISCWRKAVVIEEDKLVSQLAWLFRLMGCSNMLSCWGTLGFEGDGSFYRSCLPMKGNIQHTVYIGDGRIAYRYLTLWGCNKYQRNPFRGAGAAGSWPSIRFGEHVVSDSTNPRFTPVTLMIRRICKSPVLHSQTSWKY